MSIDINKMQVDIDNLQSQNVNDLASIKELYRKLKEIEERISQIKYINGSLAYKLKKEYESLKKIILDENVQVQLNNKIDETKTLLQTEVTNINEQLDNKIDETKTLLQSDVTKINEQLDNIDNKQISIFEMLNNEKFDEKFAQFGRS